MKTNTREIAPEQWRDFFDRFSRLYKGRVVTVSMRGRDRQLRTVGRRLPLLGITAERTGAHLELEVIAGDSPDAHVTHVIQRPSHVHVVQIVDGQDTAIEIDSAEGLEVRIEWDNDVPEGCLAGATDTSTAMCEER